MDLLAEIGSSRKYNFHSHTQFCDGRAAMADFVEAAVAEGFTHYGFTPHSPVPIASPCNMSMESVAEYQAEFKRLKSQWGSRINLYAAMEIDYLGEDWGPSNQYFEGLNLDYRIGSVHFIPSSSGYVDVDGCPEDFKVKMQRYFSCDIKHVVETFYHQSMKMVEAGGFDVIGHFDKIGFNASSYKPGIEEELWYRALVYELMEMIVSANVVVEINTKAWDNNQRMFPREQWLRYLVEHNVPIIVNSDAHFPHLINAGREKGLALLRELQGRT